MNDKEVFEHLAQIREIFEYFRKIKVTTGSLISHEMFLPIRDKISIADASNGMLDDADGSRFWGYIDELIKRNIIKDVKYIMQDLWTEQIDERSIDELFESSQHTYLEYILFKTDLSEEDVEKMINTLNENFFAECFFTEEFGDKFWCITWD